LVLSLPPHDQRKYRNGPDGRRDKEAGRTTGKGEGEAGTGRGKREKRGGVGGVPRSFTVATAPEHYPRRAPAYGRGHAKETGDSTHEKMSELSGASRSCKGIPMEALP